MKIRIVELEPAQLEFGGPGVFSDPKVGLKEAGPFDLRFGAAQLKEIRIGLVGTEEMTTKALQWVEACKTNIPTTMKNFKQYPDYDGFETIFRSQLNTNPFWTFNIPADHLEKAISFKDNTERFEAVLELYGEGIKRISELENNRPNVIICALSDSVMEACHHVERKLTKEEKTAFKKMSNVNKVTQQLSLFEEATQETEEDLLYRDFRRALKAKAILAKIPIQIGHNRLFTDQNDNQDAATRAWNFSVALYYKAGGIPWRLKSTSTDTCFVGITFHHVKTNQKAVVKSCLAQAFSSDGEGFALRGGDIAYDPDRTKMVHLSEDQAYDLGLKIIEEYTYRTGLNPQRVVLHKTSFFNESEEEGFRRAFNSIPVVDLINLLPTSFRLLKHNAYPVNRGTLCTVNGKQSYLFSTGYIKELGTYPGAHIPRPIEIRSNEDLDIDAAAKDILGLARMNWNTSSITGGQPVTLFFSRQVGGILAELNVKNIESIPTSFRYYI
ncbi:argonaute/piwi family protein [Pedobacter terrae]|uniref:argonaute/piwi family protein n=1 Tax=Pedobacter terrae TaxID=405671 RepID=UPI002FF953D7